MINKYLIQSLWEHELIKIKQKPWWSCWLIIGRCMGLQGNWRKSTENNPIFCLSSVDFPKLQQVFRQTVNCNHVNRKTARMAKRCWQHLKLEGLRTHKPSLKGGFKCVVHASIKLAIKSILYLLWSYKERTVSRNTMSCLNNSKRLSFLFPVKSAFKSKKEELSPIASTLTKRPSGPLEVGTPFYQDSQLQVRVYWKKRGGMNSVIYSLSNRISTQLCPSLILTSVHHNQVHDSLTVAQTIK